MRGGVRVESITREWADAIAGGDAEFTARFGVVVSALSLLGGPDVARLRRCANPACSMLFVTGDARRRFCTQNICANRVRVSRHYHRQHRR